jgi:hypothetical protein
MVLRVAGHDFHTGIRRFSCLTFCLHPRLRAGSDKTSGPPASRGFSHLASLSVCSSLESCTIIVTSANKVLSPIHDRIPVIIDPENFQAWLGPERDGNELSDLLVPHGESGFEAYSISTAVNKPANNNPGLIERV